MKKIKNNKKKKGLTILTILFVIADILAIAGFVMMYGPWTYFQNLFVTTAMKTRSHQYLAEVFYSKEKIESIKSSNNFITINEDVNLDDIIIDTSEKSSYKDKNEEE